VGFENSFFLPFTSITRVVSGQELFETEPKNVVTITFEVSNTADEELEFISDVKFPAGGKLITPSFPFRLAPNATEIRLVSFFTPQTALTGRYEISYLIRSSRDTSISDAARIFVIVLPVTKHCPEWRLTWKGIPGVGLCVTWDHVRGRFETCVLSGSHQML